MASPYQPAEFGEMGLRHEVNVFVFRPSDYGLEYLLLQPEPRHDTVWRPVVGPVDLDQDLFDAAVKGVRQEIGLDAAFDLVAPAPGLLKHEGDMQLIEWPFGYQVRHPATPIRRKGSLAALAWRRFDDALRTLELETHRQNLLQLHWYLMAA